MWSGIRNNFRRLALTAFAGAALVAGLSLLSPEAAQAATLYISEFASPVGQVGSVQANVYPQPAITDQTVAITGASVQSAAFNASTHAIQVECDADCSISIGSNPTATTTNYLMGDGIPYQFVVVPGQKIAVISNTSGGSGSDVNIVAVGGNAVTTSLPVTIVGGGGGATTIADGADVTQGAIADAAVAAGAAGTVNAHLRTISGQLPATVGQKAMAASLPVVLASDQSSIPVTISGNQAINLVQVAGASVATGHGTASGSIRVELPTDGTGVVGLTAGSAIVGKVGIDQTTPGTTNGVQVVASTNITTASTTVTRPGDTNAYAANDAYANSTTVPTTGGFTLTSACRASGGNGTIQSAAVSASAGTAYQGEIWVFDQAVTAINDNAAFTVSDSDVLNLVGVIPFNTTDVTAANAVSYVTGLNIGYTCVGTANLRYLVKIMAAVTPGNAEVLALRVQVQN